MKELIGFYLLNSIVALTRLSDAACIEQILSFILAHRKIKDLTLKEQKIKKMGFSCFHKFL